VAPAAYPAYGQPAAAGYYAPPTNTLAILALVLGFVVPLGGIICGHLALGQIKRTGEAGHGLAMAGLIIGYVLTGLTVLIVIGYIIAIVVTLGAVSTYSS
jgi:peptidyl-prolyl cis-trans isomerase B (cyclophilin B)